MIYILYDIVIGHGKRCKLAKYTYKIVLGLYVNHTIQIHDIYMIKCTTNGNMKLNDNVV